MAERPAPPDPHRPDPRPDRPPVTAARRRAVAMWRAALRTFQHHVEDKDDDRRA